jgi:hypothetical protein
MHISRRETPGVTAITSSRNVFLGITAGFRCASAEISVTVVNVHLPMSALLQNKNKMAFPYAKKAMEQAIIKLKMSYTSPIHDRTRSADTLLKSIFPEDIVDPYLKAT